MDASWTDNLLLLSAVHFQQRNFSESLFFAQQAARVDPSFAEAFSSIGAAHNPTPALRPALLGRRTS